MNERNKSHHGNSYHGNKTTNKSHHGNRTTDDEIEDEEKEEEEAEEEDRTDEETAKLIKKYKKKLRGVQYFSSSFVIQIFEISDSLMSNNV